MKKFSRFWQSSRKAADRREKKLRVVAHDPGYAFRIRILVLLLLVGTGCAGFYLGTSFAWNELDVMRSELGSVTEENGSYKVELDTLRRRVAILERGNQISQQAAEEVRQELIRLREEKISLSRDIRFYQNIMNPELANQGVSVKSFELQPAGDSGRFQWKMTVVQNGKNHRFQKGRLLARLEGFRNGKKAGYDFAELTPEFNKGGEKLGFRYFQGIPGDGIWGSLKLPEGFEPERLDVTIQLSSPSKKVTKKSFDWFIEESE
ncbi:hypothetical protein M3P05_11250 [Sansalvadorimonas sp. 2012CJ34-2]|uniref:Uncharacterized protein n=1 Tax=Parendozoicomonas callyspongiae TaxID=2942213 RepID=A0ABT0PGJ2_9GAMM|nr:DUF6776 family protein [Sansalvadorimonas sp. 2012CJ34-2]MCL6270498.1 hypothetical protein [Sansalvadorimonas sp. 2012CJ34-2]